MTVPSRGVGRRGGRRPGWLLLTVLFVLTIVASSALVFTNSVELLKLAVILSLWAAVVGAFVSVVYRRQSDADQAQVRDLKLVYDLQLDREISARQEYELTVESKLRQELAYELRGQASDEVAALRAELAALRTNLEVLFDANLSDRPALERDRASRNYDGWAEETTIIPPVPGRVASSRITPVSADENVTRTAENGIIDVPEEPLAPAPEPEPRRRRRREEPAINSEVRDAAAALSGSHRRPVESGAPETESRESGGRRRRAERHMEAVPSPAPVPVESQPTAPASVEDQPAPQGQHAGGQSVAELMARLQSGGATGGGGRRRRAE